MSKNPLNLPAIPHAKSDWRGRLLLLACKLLGFNARGASIMSKSQGSIQCLMIGRSEESLFAMVSEVARSYNDHLMASVLLEAALRRQAAPSAPEEESALFEEWPLKPEKETIH
jgi:hypothetical protein